MKIAIDLDGPVYEWDKTARYMLRVYRGRHGLRYPGPEWLWPNQSWHDIRDEDWEWLWTEGVELGLFRYGHVTRGAIVGLRALAKAGHELLVVTHRPRVAVPDTIDWLSFLHMPFSEVHILSDEQPKSSVTADILIDDRPQNIEEWEGHARRGLLFDATYNRFTQARERVHDWREIEGKLT